MSILKRHLDDLDELNKRLNQALKSLDDAKKNQTMPTFFDSLFPTSKENFQALEERNKILEKRLLLYSNTLTKVSSSLDKVVIKLKQFKGKV